MCRTRNVLYVFILIILLAVPILNISAHPGGTDSDGGHTNHSTGEYHYHHGYSAHQHPGGVCPYDYDDNTNYNNYDTDDDSDDNVYVTKKEISSTEDTSKSLSYDEILERIHEEFPSTSTEEETKFSLENISSFSTSNPELGVLAEIAILILVIFFCAKIKDIVKSISKNPFTYILIIAVIVLIAIVVFQGTQIIYLRTELDTVTQDYDMLENKLERKELGLQTLTEKYEALLEEFDN